MGTVHMCKPEGFARTPSWQGASARLAQRRRPRRHHGNDMITLNQLPSSELPLAKQPTVSTVEVSSLPSKPTSQLPARRSLPPPIETGSRLDAPAQPSRVSLKPSTVQRLRPQHRRPAAARLFPLSREATPCVGQSPEATPYKMKLKTSPADHSLSLLQTTATVPQ